MEIGCVIGKVVAQCPSCIYDCLRCDAENARKEARTGKRLSTFSSGQREGNWFHV